MAAAAGDSAITDFQAPYERGKAAFRQKCLVHLFRELEKVLVRNRSPGRLAFSKKLKRLLKDTPRRRGRGDVSEDPYASRRARFDVRLDEILEPPWEDAEERRSVKRLRKHRDELFRFLDDFLTDEFLRRHKVFLYKYNPQRGVYEIASRDYKTIKATMLFKMTNMGFPPVDVVDGNFHNRGEMLLKHRHEGFDLEIDEAEDVMLALYKLRGCPINLWTIVTAGSTRRRTSEKRAPNLRRIRPAVASGPAQNPRRARAAPASASRMRPA